MTINETQISASDFKKHFLSLIDEVKKTHNSIIITKRKLPVAKVVPLENDEIKLDSYFGYMKGYIKINDDLVNCSFEDEWELDSDQQK